MQRCFLEILRIGWKNLPARHLLPQHLDGSHVGELPPQTPVLVFGCSEPHPVVCRLITFVAEDEDNLVLNVDREAAEHGARLGRQRSDRVEHEFMWDRLARLDVEQGVVQRKEGRVATGLRHASQKSRSVHFSPTDDDFISMTCHLANCRQRLPYRIVEGLPVIRTGQAHAGRFAA